MIDRLLSRVAVASLVFLGATTALSQTPDVARPDTSYVEYTEPWITLPLGIGLRLPQYNRVDGLALPWGPQITFAEERVKIDPTITYRSHIGKLDPFVLATARAKNGLGLELAGGRGTFTNDAWIRSDIVNSLAALFVGSDARNYFRGDRGWAMISKGISSPGILITPAIGARFENDWSTGVPVRHTTAPWSMFYKDDTLKMRRVNPSIDAGHVASALGRLVADYERSGVKGSFDGLVEHAFKSPDVDELVGGDALVHIKGENFTQVTLHDITGFPTFGTQRFDFRGHAVFTGNHAPRQRYAYLGGAGTLATVDLLALGGDRLFFVSGEYSIPINQITIPVVTNPIVSFIYSAGSAGVGSLPDLIQNIGAAIGFKVIKFEYDIDPNYKKTSYTHKSAFSISLELPM